MVHHILRQQTTAFEINVSFGFILRNVETEELRYYHSSKNNSRFFDVPHRIRTEEDVDKFLADLSVKACWNLFANSALTQNGSSIC